MHLFAFLEVRANSKQMGTIIWRVALVAFIALAIRGAYHVAGDVRNTHSSANWPATPGAVLRFVDVTSPTTRQAWPDDEIVEYRYNVNGREYNGRRISFARRKKWAYEDVATLIKPWFSHPETTVFFDPNDPKQSVLQRGGSNALNIGFLCLQVAAIIVLSLLLGVSTWCSRKA